jgi:hypothetical protein
MQRNVLHAGTAPLRLMFPSMVDQNQPHNLGGKSVEMSAIFPGRVLLVQQLQAELIDQRRRLQIAPGSLTPDESPRHLTQMRIDQGNKLLKRARLTLFPPGQQQGDFAWEGFQSYLQWSISSGLQLSIPIEKSASLKSDFRSLRLDSSGNSRKMSHSAAILRNL